MSTFVRMLMSLQVNSAYLQRIGGSEQAQSGKGMLQEKSEGEGTEEANQKSRGSEAHSGTDDELKQMVAMGAKGATDAHFRVRWATE